MPRPKLRDEALRRRVLDAAMAQLEAVGPRGVTARAVAAASGTSTAALYELFGDKAGLLRAVYFAGFGELGARLAALPDPSPAAALTDTVGALRDFSRDRRALWALMFARPFTDFSPSAAELAAGASVRSHIVRRCAARLGLTASHPDAADLAHALLGLAQGLALQEASGWLGSTSAARDRRWARGADALIAGFAGGGPP